MFSSRAALLSFDISDSLQLFTCLNRDSFAMHSQIFIGNTTRVSNRDLFFNAFGSRSIVRMYQVLFF